MPFTAPHSKQFLAEPPLDGEEPASVPPDNLRPLAAHAGSSIPGPGYDEIETWLFLVQMGQQPDFPPDETQSPGIGEHFTTQSTTEDRRNRTTGCTSKPRPACAYCSKDFGRIQELQRHVKDMHMLPHQCPFCPFMWTRPGRLKDHLLAYHVERFSPEILEAIKPLYGAGFVKFLGENVHCLDVEPTLQPRSKFP